MNRIMIAALLALGTSTAYGDQMSWTSAGNNVWNMFYVSPYQAQDQTANKALTLFCLDYNDEIAPPFSWQADVNSLTASNINDFQFGGTYTTTQGAIPAPALTAPLATTQGIVGLTANTTIFDRYLAVAWLFTQIQSAIAVNPSDLYTLEDVYQVAAWKFFANGATSPWNSSLTNLQDLQSRINSTGGSYGYDSSGFLAQKNSGTYTFNTAVNQAITDALAAVGDPSNPNSSVAGGWSVVTGNENWVNTNYGGKPVQEFLTYQPVSTPEPTAVLLLGTVIGLLGITFRRRLSAS